MKNDSLHRMAWWLAAGAGSLDLATGVALVSMPAETLSLMQVEAGQGAVLVYLRWIGAFVGAVGASYLLALAAGGRARLRSVLEFTLLVRLAVGLFTAVALGRGWLGSAWLSVPVTDLTLAAAQIWLLAKGVGGDE
jgi:hypothetical protein